jgi:hypothetical protein
VIHKPEILPGHVKLFDWRIHHKKTNEPPMRALLLLLSVLTICITGKAQPSMNATMEKRAREMHRVIEPHLIDNLGVNVVKH